LVNINSGEHSLYRSVYLEGYFPFHKTNN
jgi:hypothetical protein